MVIKTQSWINFFLIILFKILLEAVYLLYISKQYAYYGFTLNVNEVKLLESYFICIIMYFLLNKNEHRPSSIVIIILFLFMMIPTLSLYWLKDESRLYVYFFSLSFFITSLITKLPYLKIWKIKNSNKVVIPFIVVLSLSVYYIILYYNGLPSARALDLLSVYEVRSGFNQGHWIMGYLIPWQARVLNVFLLCLGFYKKNYKLVVVALGMQLILFLMTGHKSFLFIPVLVLGLYFAIRLGSIRKLLAAGLILVLSAGLLAYYLFHVHALLSIVIRRVFFVPAQNYFYYYDFFSHNEFVKLSHSIFGFLFPYPYDMSIPNLIGLEYYNSPGMWVNTGYLADAYMNFGLLGMIIFSVVLGVVLLFTDSIIKGFKNSLFTAMIVPSYFSLIDGALFTTLLTGGILFSLLLLYLYGNKEKLQRLE